MATEEVFEDCHSSDDEVYEDCPAADPCTSLTVPPPQESPVTPARADQTASPADGEDLSACQQQEPPVTPTRADQTARPADGEDLSACQQQQQQEPPVTPTRADQTASPADGEDLSVNQPPVTPPVAGQDTVVDDGKDASSGQPPEPELPPAAAAPEGVSGAAGDWDVSEGGRQPRGSLSSEGDSSESGPAREAMARSWHVLERSDSAAATAAGDTPSPSPDEAPRPAGAAPDMAQLADAVCDPMLSAASDESEEKGAAGDGAAAAPPRDSDDDAELVTDPDAVDEEALRRLDETEAPEQRELRRERAAQLKAEGNQLYAAATYDAARERYTAALRLCPLSAARERAVLFSNRAACRARADDESGAVADCSRALELDEGYARPLQRRAELHERAERLDEALDDWRRLLALHPDCGEARRAVARLPPQIAERNERLKSEMLGKLKELGNMFMRPFGLSTDNFQMEQNESGGYSVQFKQS